MSEAAYNQGVGSQYYQQAFNNFQTGQTNRFNQLASVAGMGENAAAGVGNNGLQTANMSGQNSMNAAGAQIAAANSQANNLTGSINSLSNYYQMQQLMGNTGQPMTSAQTSYPQETFGQITPTDTSGYPSFTPAVVP